MRKFQVGDKVVLTIAEGHAPCFGWGAVGNGAIGTLIGFDVDGDMFVNFKEQDEWLGRPHEFSHFEKIKTRGRLYAVVAKDKPNIFHAITAERDYARLVKAELGGKAAGYQIIQFKAEKEVR